ncbi:gluconokinase [Microlunatus panaciterrae]|uniref:Gluconokinase n=1 Tax=Microlunatus panaciterrae TaxID=400768 RepID=A0ABS2RLG9_9ACTN|nr:gluconokinase [Microlunatus panaciterrae]MBM7799422.1 gluconokinase [Microlunatus panaciterrae]
MRAVDGTAVVVMGVAGSGKTTVATLLGARLGWQVAEADDFHSSQNVAKMASGVPLTDADRQPWLIAIRDWISASDTSVLVTCSALRRSYRDVLRTADKRVRFLHLDGTADLIGERIRARVDHFMPPALLDSQLSTLEPLQPDEDGVVIGVSGTPHGVADRAMAALQLTR